MDIDIVILISTILQIGAAVFAFRLIGLTGFRTAWVLISLALCLMAVRRALHDDRISLWVLGVLQPPEGLDEAVVLVTSILMLAGVLLITPLFRTIKESKEVLQRAKEDLEVTVAERTDAWREANARLSVELDERRQAEYRLAQYAQDLRDSNAELEQFAYVASHDLQEPLRMVASFTQLLAKRYQGKLDQDADEFIGFAVDGATRMQALINDLLAYSRVGTRGRPLAPTDGTAALQEARSNLTAALAESGAVVTHDPLPTVLADERQLVQLFQNLIANAVKFRGPEAPRIHVSAGPQDGGWIFAVRDNGIGIAKEHQDRIFTIFQRLHPRAEYSGTGIGLALCKKIVERHGGRIWVESEVGRGSTFYFNLTGVTGEARHGQGTLQAH